MKVRIVSTDGIPHNAQIWEHQTGEVIEGVVAAFIHPFNVHSRQITGEITVLATAIDVVADVSVKVQCPHCGLPFPAQVQEPTPVEKQDDEEDSQVFLEDHLSKATWPYGGQAGTMLRDAVAAADKEMQEALEKAYMDVQKIPIKRLTRTELQEKWDGVSTHSDDDAPVIHFDPHHQWE